MNLKQEFEIRLKEKLFYSENELWTILKNLLNALSFYKGKNISIGNLRLENIYIDNYGNYKIIDSNLFQDFRSNYNQIIFEIKEKKSSFSNVFLSPNQLKVTKKKKYI